VTDEAKSDGKKPTERLGVLLVEDEPDSAELMRAILEMDSHRVVEARNGEEALARAGDSGIGAILLDVMLPGIDGFEVCRRLRADPATAHLPVAFLSAKSRPEDRAAGLEAGGDVYLTKPISRAALIQAVRWLLDPHREPGSLPTPASPPPQIRPTS